MSSETNIGHSFEYSDDLFNTKSAERVVPVLIDLFAPRSVIDIGCGIGTWTRVFQDADLGKVVGVDFSVYEEDDCHIPRDSYVQADLREPYDHGERFDLALSLEVAEHLPDADADTFVETLTRHSDVVVFSAAVPGQDGQGHINNQWPSYWVEKFEKHGYMARDVLRPHFWDDEEVMVWYRQNMILFTKTDAFDELIQTLNKPEGVVSLIHPEMVLSTEAFKRCIECGDISLIYALRIFTTTCKAFIRRKLGGS